MLKRKNKKPLQVFSIEDESRLLLLSEGANSRNITYTNYRLLMLSRNEYEYNIFMPIVCDCIELLFNSLIAVSDFHYDFIDTTGGLQKKNLKEPEFVAYPEKIIKYIELHPEEQCVFKHIKNSKNLFLSIAKKNIFADFIKAAYIDTFTEKYNHNNYYLIFYGIRNDENKELLSSLDKSVPCIISVLYDAQEDTLEIALLDTEYTQENLLKTLKTVAEKHGKRLEINL